MKKTTLFALISLWLCLEYIVLGPFSAIPIFDYADSWVPAQHALKTNFFSHGLTYWLPYEGCGVDRLAQDYFHTYIPNLLSLVLPLWLSNPVHIFLQYFLAMFFLFRVCREHLGMSDTSSTLAGILFAMFCQFNPMLFGVYTFPLTLYYFDKICLLNKKGYVCFATVGLGVLTVLLSLVVYLPYTLPILAVWFLFVKKRNDVRFWTVYFLYGLTIVVLKTPSLMAFLLNAGSSHRDFILPGYKTMSKDFYLASLKRLLPWVFPSVTCFLSLVLGAYFSRLKDKRFNTFLVLIFLTTIGATIFSFAILYFRQYISLAGYQFDRFACIGSPLFYSIGIACAVEYIPAKNISIKKLTRQINTRTISYAIIFLSLFTDTVSIKISRGKDWLRNGSYHANFNSRQMQEITSGNKSNDPFRVATVASLIFPMYAATYGLESTDAYSNLYPMRYKKFWSKVILPLTQKNEKINTYFNNWGNRVYLFPPAEIPGPEIRFRDYYNLNLLSLANTKYIISRSKLIDDDLVLVQTPEKEFYRLSRYDQALMRIKENFKGNSTLFIYENKLALPRFFVAGKINALENDNELLNALSAAAISSLRETIYLNKNFLGGINVDSLGLKKSEIQLSLNSPDIIRLNVKLEGNGFLVVSNSYSPYWKVSIDGKPGRILPADHAFWGVFLKEGSHQVEFSYDPPYKFFRPL